MVAHDMCYSPLMQVINPSYPITVVFLGIFGWKAWKIKHEIQIPSSLNCIILSGHINDFLAIVGK